MGHLERQIVMFPTVVSYSPCMRARWPVSDEASVMHANVTRWPHCLIQYVSV